MLAPSLAVPHPSDALRRVARLFKILTLVRSRRPGQSLGRRALAEECQCSLRHLQRDINLLQLEAGVPLEYDARQKAYVLPEKGWVYPIAPMTPEDVLALAILSGFAGRADIPQSEAIQQALTKATAGLTPGLRALLGTAAAVLDVGRTPRHYGQAPLSFLMEAATRQETVEIEYRSRSGGEQSWRRVDPYEVSARDGQYWELHGWCHRRQAIRTFALDQVRQAQGTGASFVRNEAVWLAFRGAAGAVGGLRGEAPVSVHAEFSPEVAAYVLDREWPETLMLEKQETGAIRMTGTALGTAGLIAELLRWRHHCYVIGGSELRAAVAEEAAAIAALYAEKNDKKEKG